MTETFEDLIEVGAEQMSDADLREAVAGSEEIMRRSRGPLAKLIEDIKLLIQLVRDYGRGAYRQVPWWAISASTAALLYVLCPADLIPDFIPGFGLVDDAGVISACLCMVHEELVKYRKWRGTSDARAG
jgi:uncharacterized membrane protein YkvA (DUF1232 family)